MTSATESIASTLNALGLRGLAKELTPFLAQVTKQRLAPTQIIEHLIKLEQRDRAERSLKRRQACSRIGSFKTIVDFDWSWPKHLNRSAVQRALDLHFVSEGANLIIVGAHGLGKTTILKNIAHNAVVAGHTVRFSTAAKILNELAIIDSPSKLKQRLSYYTTMRLLCVDELGYLSYDSRAADLLFEIVTRRYELGRPIAMTTNLAFKDWTTVFPHATCTVALVDRLTHRADILKVEGDSWRRKEAQQRQARLNEGYQP